MDPENKISDTSMNTTLTPTNNHIAQTKPRKRRFEAYDLDKQRSIFFSNAYGRAAKRLYKQYIEYGFEPEMVLPQDLKYYPLSGRFIKRTGVNTRGLKIGEKTSYKNYLASYTLANTKNIKAYAGLELMRLFKKKLATMLQLHGGLKFNYEINCAMVKYLDGELIAEDTRWVNSTMRTVNNSSEIDTKIKQAMQQIQQAVPELEAKNGSMWTFSKVLMIHLNVAKYKPLKGSSYMELPKELATKKAIVNVKNTDNECFRWSILSALRL